MPYISSFLIDSGRNSVSGIFEGSPRNQKSLSSFSQRFTRSRVKPPMPRFGSRINKIDFVDVLRACALALIIFMTITFFAGCETANKQQADSNSMIQKAPSGQEIHGEAGVMYGSGNLSRH